MSDERVLVDQTILASDPKREGNCLSACVATWLGRPLEHVPHFIERGEGSGDAWWWMLVGYMAGNGWWPYELDSVDDDPGQILFVMGMSPRGVCHQVLYRNGVLFHDPHPSRDGITDVREVISWRRAEHDHVPTLTTGGEG